MKNFLSFLLIIAMLCSCRALLDIFGTPNDDPGWMHRATSFKKSMDSLQLEVDEFVEGDTIIQRHYNKGNYDRGIYRKYTTLCNNDTLEFSLVFWSNGDTSSGISVSFFRLYDIPFSTLDNKEQRRSIKNNKAVYDTCHACYQRLFLAPLKKRLQK